MKQRCRLCLAALLVGFLVVVPVAFAKETSQPPALSLFDNLKVPPAKWTYRSELDSLSALASLENATEVSVKTFVTPDHKRYYFGVATFPDHHIMLVANRTVFASLAQWKAYIHNQSDYELVGASLGVYNGPITVTVQEDRPSH
ncbi:MAG: hypothetical protein OWT28_07875 [Firmicutes bacterium]|nr:hypothetical protein [Bacillota bacterium]